MDQSSSCITPKNFEEIESYGILAGEDDGNKVYVGRAMDQDGNFVPARIVPALKTSFFAYKDQEAKSDKFEVLDTSFDYKWAKATDSNISEAAKISGQYIGRGDLNGHVIVGRVDVNERKLIGSYNGNAVLLPSYEVLICKSKADASGSNRDISSVSQKYTTIKTSVIHSTTVNESCQDLNLDQESCDQKIRELKYFYEEDKRSFTKEFESRIDLLRYEKQDAFKLVEKLRIENFRLINENKKFEEKFSCEHKKVSSFECKVNEFASTNCHLVKKVKNLEEMNRIEKLKTESIAKKFCNSESYIKTLQLKLTSYEETIDSLKQKVFKLEGELMNSSSSESLMKRLAECEETINYLRIQIESFMKKLDISSDENEFLLQKLEILKKTLSSYQNQIDCLNNKLRSAKTVISLKHSELSRANAQVSKYEAALSSCYSVNNKMSTELAGLRASMQNPIGSDCSFNLVDCSSSTRETSRQTLLTLFEEMSIGSDSFHTETESTTSFEKASGSRTN